MRVAQTVKRAFKYRFYPTRDQAAELARTFGCVRLVYNKALADRSREARRLSYEDASAALTRWKRSDELTFLREVSSVPLQQALRHLQRAFANFFAGQARYPAFKSRKKSRAAAEYTRSAFRYREGQVTLAKMNQPLDIVWSRPLPYGAQPTTVTVSRDQADRWFVSIVCEEVIQPLEPSSKVVGVDVGLTSLLTLSTGEKVPNLRHERRNSRKLAKAQRALGRKEKGSANRAKARLAVARIHARVSDRRRDHLHQVTTRLVRENQVIAVEDLAVGNLVKNRRLARAIADASWRELCTMLEYKAAWYGRQLVVVDRWLPSSKTCSACGALIPSLPLDVRHWACPCGVFHDRDVNAAKNILAAGLVER